ncbi:hypothetical protein [Sulfurimonas sp.]|nr:hypothetical protein [Sulfurimonas sp.]
MQGKTTKELLVASSGFNAAVVHLLYCPSGAKERSNLAQKFLSL